MGLLNVISLGIITYIPVALRMAFSHTTPNVNMFYFVVDKCYDLRLIAHWFGGDGMYVKPNPPTHIVFSVTTLLTVVSSYRLELKFSTVVVVKADGLITFKVLIEIDDFVYDSKFFTTIRFCTLSILQKSGSSTWQAD